MRLLPMNWQILRAYSPIQAMQRQDWSPLLLPDGMHLSSPKGRHDREVPALLRLNAASDSGSTAAAARKR